MFKFHTLTVKAKSIVEEETNDRVNAKMLLRKLLTVTFDSLNGNTVFQLIVKAIIFM